MANYRNGYFWRIEMRLKAVKVGKRTLKSTTWKPLYAAINGYAPYLATKRDAEKLLEQVRPASQRTRHTAYRVKRVKLEVTSD